MADREVWGHVAVGGFGGFPRGRRASVSELSASGAGIDLDALGLTRLEMSPRRRRAAEGWTEEAGV